MPEREKERGNSRVPTEIRRTLFLPEGGKRALTIEWSDCFNWVLSGLKGSGSAIVRDNAVEKLKYSCLHLSSEN